MALSFKDWNFAKDLAAQTSDREQWLSVMRFGMAQIEQSQELLMNLIVEEALRHRGEQFHLEGNERTVSEVSEILGQLGIRLTVS